MLSNTENVYFILFYFIYLFIYLFLYLFIFLFLLNIGFSQQSVDLLYIAGAFRI